MSYVRPIVEEMEAECSGCMSKRVCYLRCDFKITLKKNPLLLGRVQLSAEHYISYNHNTSDSGLYRLVPRHAVVQSCIHMFVYACAICRLLVTSAAKPTVLLNVYFYLRTLE